MTDEHQHDPALPGVDIAGEQDRRAVLKKAAAAAVGGAIWAGPRVEGLSVVPDFAAAGTASGSQICFQVISTPTGNTGFTTNYFTATGASNPGVTVNQAGPTQNAAVIMSAPLGVAGNVTYTLPQGRLADGDAQSGTITFAIDPPFNKCQSTTGGANWRDAFNPSSPVLSVNFTGNVVPNNNSPVVVPFTMSSAPGLATRVLQLTVCVQCQA